ncbi:hypothetical protein ACIPW5_25435 [Streptomyces sp. NPDC090077]|uniref:hypothetical protein n=1 Tax=Streptomyces sp. NPDC090077 TaxID=3365938 RepID=UPI003825BC72
MDEYDWAIQEAKGWLDVTVEWKGDRQLVDVCDPVRLAQTITSETGRLGHFKARRLLVVSGVTREHIASAISAIAHEGFFDPCQPRVSKTGAGPPRVWKGRSSPPVRSVGVTRLALACVWPR